MRLDNGFAERQAQPRPIDLARPSDLQAPKGHGHLVDVQARNLLCSCRGCYLLFTAQGAGGGHYRAVPDRYVAFPDFRLTPGQWDTLQIPVSVAFFFVNSALDRVAAFRGLIERFAEG